MDETKVKILNAAIEEFGKSGLKFTMDDIAKNLSMSKKTIYTVFRDKETLFFQMVDYCFDKIKEAEHQVMVDPTLSTVEKLRKMMSVLPEIYKDIDLRQLSSLKDKYPKTYAAVEKRLESGWENTIALINKGIAEGVLRPMNVLVIKTMYEATLEQFFQRDVLMYANISYQDALKTVVDIIIDGITTT